MASLKKIFPSLCKLYKHCNLIISNLDGVAVCEEVGVYIMHLQRTVMRKENVCLYRYEGLGILQNFSGPEIERTRKQIIFKGCVLSIAGKTSISQ